MSKYIAALPLGKIRRLQVYVNTGRKTLAKVRQETGADYVLYGGLFNQD